MKTLLRIVEVSRVKLSMSGNFQTLKYHPLTKTVKDKDRNQLEMQIILRIRDRKKIEKRQSLKRTVFARASSI